MRTISKAVLLGVFAFAAVAMLAGAALASGNPSSSGTMSRDRTMIQDMKHNESCDSQQYRLTDQGIPGNGGLACCHQNCECAQGSAQQDGSGQASFQNRNCACSAS